MDVVIAGGGPNGLMLACELALNGVRSVVLEAREDPIRAEQRANGMVGQVVRLLDRRGLYRRLGLGGKGPRPAAEFMFAAFPLPLGTLADNPVYTVLVPQQKIEETLAERARELGVEVRRGHALSGFTQKDHTVVVEVNGEYEIEAGYLVGADGGKSLTRKLSGIAFPGITHDNTVSRAVHATVPKEWIDRKTGGLDVPGFGRLMPFSHTRTERGLVTFAPFPDGKVLVSVSTRERPETGDAFTMEEMREVMAYVLGADLPLGAPDGPGPHMMRRLSGGNTRIAERYRDGRVILLGDAAHVHAAIGGPGLNLGLQDTANLGWKLAATVRGTAPAGLLDTYESERRPFADRVAMHTRAQSVLSGPGPEITALRELFGELLAEPVVLQHVADLMAGADVRYETGSDHPLAGKFFPGDAVDMSAGRAALSDPAGTLAQVVAPWRDRVDVVRTRIPGATAALIRPDCYVAWASDDTRPSHRDLRRALEQWFGLPSAA